jgi:hypothetical protein
MSRVLSGLRVDAQWVTVADALLTDVCEIAANIFHFDPNLIESAEVSTSKANMSILVVQKPKPGLRATVRQFGRWQGELRCKSSTQCLRWIKSVALTLL